MRLWERSLQSQSKKEERRQCVDGFSRKIRVWKIQKRNRSF